jgi:hypothetical protein
MFLLPIGDENWQVLPFNRSTGKLESFAFVTPPPRHTLVGQPRIDKVTRHTHIDIMCHVTLVHTSWATSYRHASEIVSSFFARSHAPAFSLV